MNARIETASLGRSLADIWDQELERNALGEAMLGAKMPAWLKPEHFFPTQHRRIYEAVQAVGGNPAKVNAWLRDSAPKYAPQIASAAELAAMCEEAHFAWRMGWEIDFARLRELASQRRLIEAMRRVEIQLRSETLETDGARAMLLAACDEEMPF